MSVTPSGGWVPAVIAGHTGIGLSQRAQSFVTNPRWPYNVIEPGKRPTRNADADAGVERRRAVSLLRGAGRRFPGQNLLQFFLNVVEFGMTPQQATEAPNINSYQMRSSFGEHEAQARATPRCIQHPRRVRAALQQMGYTLEFEERTSGPINAILFDRAHGTMWGASSNHGEDYGVAW